MLTHSGDEGTGFSTCSSCLKECDAEDTFKAEAKRIVSKGVAEMERRCSDTEQHCTCTGFALGFVEDDITQALADTANRKLIEGLERAIRIVTTELRKLNRDEIKTLNLADVIRDEIKKLTKSEV